MDFLADEGCDFAVVRALRAAGHDVRTVRETSPGATDQEVLRLANVALGPTIVELAWQSGHKLPGAFAVLKPGHARIVSRTSA